MLTNLKLWEHENFYKLGSQVFTQVGVRAVRQVSGSHLPPKILGDQFGPPLYWTIRHLLQVQWRL